MRWVPAVCTWTRASASDSCQPAAAAATASSTNPLAAYTFPDLESLLTKYEDLRKADIQPHVPVQHGPTTSIYYRDPDGNMVELQIDNFTTPEEATEYLRGEELHADPFGPSFDPDAMLAALRAGTPESELLTRAWASTCPPRNVPELLLT
jgi:hypothetical protein